VVDCDERRCQGFGRVGRGEPRSRLHGRVPVAVLQQTAERLHVGCAVEIPGDEHRSLTRRVGYLRQLGPKPGQLLAPTVDALWPRTGNVNHDNGDISICAGQLRPRAEDRRLIPAYPPCVVQREATPYAYAVGALTRVYQARGKCRSQAGGGEAVDRLWGEFLDSENVRVALESPTSESGSA
jgi:hypothetical protein